MRTVKKVRYLGPLEKDVARQVFKGTIPYDEVVVSDGLGKDGAPFTVPTSLPLSPYFNVGIGKYVIHAGDGYLGMSLLANDRRTLIHELVHVWQGEHSSWSAAYVFFALKDRALANSERELYGYDDKPFKPWDDYNPEQQAHIVEDWYGEGKDEFDPVKWEGDKRFYYIKRHIRGEHVDHNWILPRITPLPSGTLHVDVQSPSFDYVLVPILAQRFQADDVSGFGARARKLEEFFGKLEYADARKLLARLEARRQGDKVAQYFHDHLATTTRNSLIQILKSRV